MKADNYLRNVVPKECEAGKPLKDAETLVQAYNANDKLFLLLFAWTHLGRPDAKSCRLVSIDSEGLVAESTGPFGKAIERYEFLKEVSTIEEAKTAIEDMRSKSGIACWPPGYTGAVVVLLWLVLIMGLVSDASKVRKASWIVQIIWSLSATLVPSVSIAAGVLAVLAAVHLVEAGYIFYLCRKWKFSALSSASWALLGFALGYPVTTRMMYFDKYASSSVKEE